MPHKSEYKRGKGRKLLESAMSEVHKNMPSTCPPGGCPEKQLEAIAFSKARKAGAKMPMASKIPGKKTKMVYHSPGRPYGAERPK